VLVSAAQIGFVSRQGDVRQSQFDLNGLAWPSLNHAGFPTAHFRVLAGSKVPGLLLCYFETLNQELCSSIRSFAI
jgi:DNA-binding NarL/FixJ family response regulator